MWVSQVTHLLKVDSYKPGGGYAKFAGHDISISLGKMDLSEKYLNQYGIMTPEGKEIESIDNWVKYFHQRYLVVGRIKKWISHTYDRIVMYLFFF